jgi:diacylglycerol kinase family enzyme
VEHLFIINPNSFSREVLLDNLIAEIKQYFGIQNEEKYTIHLSRYPRDAVIVIKRYLRRVNPDTHVRVYAVGGDGILFDCLNGMVDCPGAELASIPYRKDGNNGKKGKTNDFIHAFGEKKQALFRDIALQATSPTILTDLIYYGTNYCLNACVIGTTAAGTARMADIKRRHRNLFNRFPFLYQLRLLLESGIVLFDRDHHYQQYEVSIDGADYSGCYNDIFIANGPCCGDGKCVVPAAVPDDELLDILLWKSASVLKILMDMPRYIQGRPRPQDVVLVRGRKVSIRSATPLLISMDGEVLSDTNITVEVMPGKLPFVAVQGLSYQDRDRSPRGKKEKKGKKGKKGKKEKKQEGNNE